MESFMRKDYPNPGVGTQTGIQHGDFGRRHMLKSDWLALRIRFNWRFDVTRAYFDAAHNNMENKPLLNPRRIREGQKRAQTLNGT